MCVKRRFHAAPTKKPDRQPCWSPIGRFSLRSGERCQFPSLLFGSRSFWTSTTAIRIAITRWAIAISRWASTFSPAATFTWSTTLTTTAALEAFEHLLQFVAIQCSVFVSVASVEHSLHSLGHFFAAEFAVFVFVEAHDSVEKLA